MPCRLPLFLLVCTFFAVPSAGAETAVIVQSKGIDQRVDYKSLTKFGPWDDRNYKVRAEDLKLLAPNEAELKPGIPAFFRIEMRRDYPNLMRTGPAQYPRSARQLFKVKYGGLIVNGKIERDYRMYRDKVDVPVNHEVQLNEVLGANEITVEINPVYPNLVIAGANNFGGQEMYYSSDGGLTWTIQGLLPDSCCDPTVGWSSDGTVAYAATLGYGTGLGVWFYRSTDNGHTWNGPQMLTTRGSDKEFLHVDISPGSPYINNVYLTWHDANVMQFARSTDRGVTFEPTMSFPGAPRGIGSDITTDNDGNIYYFYGAVNTQQIILLKSTDGGVTFEEPVQVSETNGAFDFPIPAMDTRRAWIYAACDADRSDGPLDGTVYVTWTDLTAPSTETPAENHARIWVAASADGGATWTKSTPHPTDDIGTVDRFNQWLTVDGNGVVHVVYYDTRHSVDRAGVDLYYTFSPDGTLSWNTPTRVSSETSKNLEDGQEFGDYNGLSVMMEAIIPTWTDNRDGPPDTKDVYAADLFNVAAGPTFLLIMEPGPVHVCAGTEDLEIPLTVASVGGFSNPVTLDFEGTLPAGITGNISGSPATPGETATVTLNVSAEVSPSAYEVEVRGTAADSDPRLLRLVLAVADAPPAPPELALPADGDPYAGAPDVPLEWNPSAGAIGYRVQVAEDLAFTSIAAEAAPAEPVYVAAGLAEGSLYYWRVAAEGACGSGAFSDPRSFLAVEPVSQGTDSCANAPALIENKTLEGTTEGATGDDMTSCASGDTKDVWFRYTPPASGTATISLCGSYYDTTLAVFDSCGGAELGCNDDSCGLSSEIILEVAAREEYRVRISGWSGDSGTYRLLVTREGAVQDGEQETHSADFIGPDNVIGLTELLRVVQFYNTDGVHCAPPDAATDDGYAPGPEGDQTCAPHNSDYNPQDWVISLSELLRMVQFYNSGGYFPCPEGEDGFCPVALDS